MAPNSKPLVRWLPVWIVRAGSTGSGAVVLVRSSWYTAAVSESPVITSSLAPTS